MNINMETLNPMDNKIFFRNSRLSFPNSWSTKIPGTTVKNRKDVISLKNGMFNIIVMSVINNIEIIISK